MTTSLARPPEDAGDDRSRKEKVLDMMVEAYKMEPATPGVAA